MPLLCALQHFFTTENAPYLGIKWPVYAISGVQPM
jgi:hypothetical protein